MAYVPQAGDIVRLDDRRPGYWVVFERAHTAWPPRTMWTIIQQHGLRQTSFVTGAATLTLVKRPTITPGMTLTYGGLPADVITVGENQIRLRQTKRQKLLGGSAITWVGETDAPVGAVVAENLHLLLNGE